MLKKIRNTLITILLLFVFLYYRFFAGNADTQMRWIRNAIYMMESYKKAVTRLLNIKPKHIEKKAIKIVDDKNAYFESPYTGFASLDEEEQQVFLFIADKLQNLENEMDLGPYDIDVQRVIKVCQALDVDFPEFFWYNAYSYTYNEMSGKIKKLTFTLNYDLEDIARRQEAMDRYVDTVVGQITEDMDDYTRVKLVHDYIIRNTDYDLETPDNQNICSVMIEGKGVCAGYAKTMTLILNKAGVVTSTVYGKTITGEPHAWNLVKVEDQYYYIDTTWDDPNYVGEEAFRDFVDYTYFNITTDDLLRSHEIDESLISYDVYKNTENSYYTRENRFYDLNLEGETGRFIDDVYHAMLNQEQFSNYKFADLSQRDQALESLRRSYVLYSTSIRYIQNEYQPTLVISFY